MLTAYSRVCGLRLRGTEELPHGWGCGGIPGQPRHAEVFERQAKNTLMLIESKGLVATLRLRTDDDGGDVASASSEIRKVRFIKDDDEEAISLEHGALNDRVEIRLQPIVSGGERAVMPVVTEVWDDEGIVGQVCSG
jgi:hypothetical protein